MIIHFVNGLFSPKLYKKLLNSDIRRSTDEKSQTNKYQTNQNVVGIRIGT